MQVKSNKINRNVSYSQMRPKVNDCHQILPILHNLEMITDNWWNYLLMMPECQNILYFDVFWGSNFVKSCIFRINISAWKEMFPFSIDQRILGRRHWYSNPTTKMTKTNISRANIVCLVFFFILSHGFVSSISIYEFVPLVSFTIFYV